MSIQEQIDELRAELRGCMDREEARQIDSDIAALQGLLEDRREIATPREKAQESLRCQWRGLPG